MSSSDRTASWRTANQGSSSTHASTNQTPPLSSSFYNNSNNPLANSSNHVKKPPSYKKNVLRPVAVRERSKSIPGCKELKNIKDPYSTTISFLLQPTTEGGEESKTQEKEKENKQPAVRVNVFCDTGTIGTAKVIDGKVRQTFRRNVTSLDVLERLLRQPEGPVEINDQLIGVTDSEDEKEDTSSAPNFKKGVELADVGLCILEGEREKLAKHLRHIDDEAEKEAAEAEAAVQKEKTKQQQQQQKQQEKELQRKQEAANQKQQQQQPPAQQQSSKSNDKQPSGEKQAQMLHKTMTESSTKKKSSNGDRVGRRRNKLNTLRKTRNLTSNGKKGILPDSSHAMHRNSKRRGGKQPSSSNAADESSRSTGKKQGRRSGRTPTKFSNSTSNKDASAVPKTTVANNSDDNDPDASSVYSSPEKDKKVTTTNNTDMFKNCGYEFHFKLPAEVMNQVDQCLRDIAKMNKVVRGVATNGRGTVFLYGNGGVAYTPSIPKALYQKLRQLRSSSFSSRPCFVSLGTRDRYYVSFNDGSGDWKGSSALDKMLKKRVLKNLAGGNTSGGAKRTLSGGGSIGGGSEEAFSMLPRSVAFGATYDTFFVVFNDGSWEYQGRSVPKSLEKKLRERDDAADLVLCNLGPNGEWFLKVESGKMWWSGISPELDAVLRKITKKGFLHNMDFGENGSYFVSYDEE